MQNLFISAIYFCAALCKYFPVIDKSHSHKLISRALQNVLGEWVLWLVEAGEGPGGAGGAALPDWGGDGGGRGGAAGPRLPAGEALGAPGLGARHLPHVRTRHVGRRQQVGRGEGSRGLETHINGFYTISNSCWTDQNQIIIFSLTEMRTKQDAGSSKSDVYFDF